MELHFRMPSSLGMESLSIYHQIRKAPLEPRQCFTNGQSVWLERCGPSSGRTQRVTSDHQSAI